MKISNELQTIFNNAKEIAPVYTGVIEKEFQQVTTIYDLRLRVAIDLWFMIEPDLQFDFVALNHKIMYNRI